MSKRKDESKSPNRWLARTLGAYVLVHALFVPIACSHQRVGAVAGPNDEGAQLRSELVGKSEALRAAQASNRQLLERMDELESARARLEADLVASQRSSETNDRISEQVSTERRALLAAVDAAQAEYRRLQESYENLRRLSDAYAEEIGSLEQRNYELDGRVAELAQALEFQDDGAGDRIAARVERIRALGMDSSRPAETGEPVRFDARPRDRRSELAEVYSLYREDPSGLWSELKGLVGHRFGSVFAGGAKWDAFDLGLFGCGAMLLVIFVWLLGSPIRELIRRRMSRELRMLRRRVHELETQPSGGARSARIRLSNSRSAIGVTAEVAVRSIEEDLTPREQIEQGIADHAEYVEEVDETLDRVLAAAAMDNAGGDGIEQAADALEDQAREDEVSSHVDALFARITEDDEDADVAGEPEAATKISEAGLESSDETTAESSRANDSEAEASTEAADESSDARVAEGVSEGDEIIVSIDSPTQHDGGVESLVVSRNTSPAAAIARVFGSDESETADEDAPVTGDTSIIPSEVVDLQPVAAGSTPSGDSATDLNDTRLNDTSISPTLILDSPAEIEALRAELTGNTLDGDDTEEAPDLMGFEPPKSPHENVGPTPSLPEPKVEEASRKKRGSEVSGNTEMLAELQDLIGDEFDSLTK